LHAPPFAPTRWLPCLAPYNSLLEGTCVKIIIWSSILKGLAQNVAVAIAAVVIGLGFVEESLRYPRKSAGVEATVKSAAIAGLKVRAEHRTLTALVTPEEQG
jgi:hypothetical protein